jgi:molybdenum cofactor biosynthesis enzyme
MAEFTHFDNDGNAHMVDVGSKADTETHCHCKRAYPDAA